MWNIWSVKFRKTNYNTNHVGNMKIQLAVFRNRSDKNMNRLLKAQASARFFAFPASGRSRGWTGIVLCACVNGSFGSWGGKAYFRPDIYNRPTYRLCPAKNKRRCHFSPFEHMGEPTACEWVSVCTFGPQRACLVTQQISVLHIKQQIQSQPSFFWTVMSHRGHFMASPFCSRSYIQIQWMDHKNGHKMMKNSRDSGECRRGQVLLCSHTVNTARGSGDVSTETFSEFKTCTLILG